MTLARHLVLLLAAAILAITVGMMPSSAQAHPGHGEFAAKASAYAAKAEQRRPPSHAADKTGFAQLGGHSRASADGWAAGDRLSCGSPCCTPTGHSSSCCCATALAPIEPAVVAPPPAITPERRRDSIDRAGIDPEALPEPPRPIA